MTELYTGSKGAMLIATMEPRYLKNALAKLKRERADDSRDAEITALEAQDAVNDAAWLAANPPVDDSKPDYAPGDEVEAFPDNAPEHFAGDHEVFS